MSTYFTIGEISKFFNISIKTLRYYDEIGLLPPAHINKDNNYRYYSVDQFMRIDLIKHFKATGMSLNVIQNILSSENSITLILENIRKQSNKLEQKIQELTAIKNYLDNMEQNISQEIEYGLEKVFIKYNDERQYMKYDVISKNLEELDINLRPVILDVEKNINEVYAQLGSCISYENIVYKGEVLYKDIKVFCKHDKNVNFLPAGEYITLIFEGSSKYSIRHYKAILDYVKENNIEVVGDFYETWMLIKSDESLEESSLIKIEILKK